MAPRANIRDVAEAAQVSVGTVSHYLNGTPVSAKRADRIKKAIEELGFTGNLLARGMRMQRSSVVGLCIPYTSLSNFTVLVDKLDEYVSGAGFEMMQVLSRQDQAQEYQRVQRLAAFKIAGLLLVPSLKPQPIFDYLHQHQLPTVIVGRPAPDETRFDQVAVDHQRAMHEVARALIERGHREILFIVRFPTLIVTEQRVEAFRNSIAGSGKTVNLKLFAAPDDEHEFAERLAAEFKGARAPTALIVSNDVMTSWALAALRKAAPRLLDEVTFLCLQKPQWADTAATPISYVEQPISDLAHICWQTLLSRMENMQEEPRRILLPAKLVMHER